MVVVVGSHGFGFRLLFFHYLMALIFNLASKDDQMSKTGRSCPGFLSVENFLSYYNPSWPTAIVLGDAICVVCVFDRI